MTLGLQHKLDILRRSPHDLDGAREEVQEPAPAVISWKPSRYNVFARTDDGRLVLWNTYHGTMTVFRPEQKELVTTLLSKQGFEGRREGVVDYLYRRGYLIEEKTDEYRRLQLAFGRQQYRTDILELIPLASEDCNFRCRYCYENFPRGTMLPWVRRGIKNLVLKRLPALRTLSVSWFGGEPLYGFDAVEELGSFFHEVAEENDLDFAAVMTTNGYLLGPEMADKLLSWRIRRYQITIDGPPESHDQSRPTRDGQGTFDTIFGNLQSLRRRSDEFHVSLRVNFDRSNYPHLDRFLDLVEEHLGDDPRFQLRFRPVGKWGGSRDEELDVCGHEERTDVYLELKHEAVRRGLQLVEDDDLRKLKGMRAPMVCYAARPYNLIVGANGKLMKCTIDLDTYDHNVIGQITEDGDLDVDPDKFAAWTEPGFEGDDKCKKCVVLPICNGVSCPKKRLVAGRSPCIPLRTTFKRELRGMVEVGESAGRTVPVGGESPRSQAMSG